MRNHDFNHNSQHNPGDRRRGGPGANFSDFGRASFGEFGGLGGPGGRPRGRRRGNKRGDVRAAALLLLSEQPMHGYQLIQEVSERSNGIWTPSPGSIYPVLQQLEDEGLVSFERVDGRKTATLTDEGIAYVEEKREEFGSPWEAVGEHGGADHRHLRMSLQGLVVAWKQIAQVGTPDQRKQATEVLEDARKAMYRILAGDEQTR